jgi:hypothetical protein
MKIMLVLDMTSVVWYIATDVSEDMLPEESPIYQVGRRHALYSALPLGMDCCLPTRLGLFACVHKL